MSDNINERFDALYSSYSDKIAANEAADPNYYNTRYNDLVKEYTGEGTSNTTPEQQTQPTENSDDNKPGQELDLDKLIFGLPPIDNDDEVVGTLVKNSFPILKLREVKQVRPEKVSGIDPEQSSYKGQAYKFAVSNDGNITYNLTNEYGESFLEEELFKATSFRAIQEMYQVGKTSRLANSFITGVKETDFIQDLGETVGKYAADSLTMIEQQKHALQQKNASISGGRIGNALFNLMGTGMRSILGGNKIDIPNIWKGSSAPVSQTFNIILHCLYPSIDELYHKQIVLPLLILFRLASPKATSSDEGQTEGDVNNPNPNDQERENDILTYENPPYIEASVDGMWKTKLGAITNMQVQMDYKHQSFAKDRPYLVNVSLTITDLYNVIVWNEERDTYAPNGQDIARNLEEHEKDTAVPKLSSTLNFEFIPVQQAPAGSGLLGSLINLGVSAYTSKNRNFISQVGAGLVGGMLNNVINQSISSNVGLQTTISNVSESVRAVSDVVNNGNGTFTASGGTAFANGLFSSQQLETIKANSTPTGWPRLNAGCF